MKQARQPIRQGGLGACNAFDTRDSAWCASYALCWLKMRKLWPDFDDIDITVPSNLHDIAELQAARGRLDLLETMVRNDEKLAASKCELNKFAEKEQDFRPGLVPSPESLPSLADMADPECTCLRKRQRKFMMIVHRSRWVELYYENLRVKGHRGWREAIRFVSASQPYAAAFLNAIPTTNQTIIPSDLLLIALQRLLGLPLSVVGGGGYSSELGRQVDAFGDVLVNLNKGSQHRHNQLVKAWATAWRAAFPGTEVPTDDSNFNSYSLGAKPDLKASYAARHRHHLLGEAKLVSPISTAKDADEATSKHKRASRFGFGATEQYLREDNLGRKEGHGHGAKPKEAHYHFALEKGHEVVMLIHEVFGGWAEGAVDMLHRLGEIREERLDKEFHEAAWNERSFSGFYATRISVALHLEVAQMIYNRANDVYGVKANAFSSPPGRNKRSSGRQ